MMLELVSFSQGDEKRYGCHAALAQGQAGAGPDRAPANLGDDLLNVGGEFVACLERTVDMRVPQYLTTQCQSLLKAIIHDVTPLLRVRDRTRRTALYPPTQRRCLGARQ